MGQLKDKAVIVTGGGRGVGRAHALHLASLGATVVVNDLATDGAAPAEAVVEEIRAAGGKAVASGLDVAAPGAGDELVELALSSFGSLDGLVNNAGILRDSVLVNLSDADWDAVLRVNLTGTMVPTRAAARHWRERTKAGESVRASVVNTSSESGVFANAGQTNYAAAKAGVAAVTEVWSKELARYGVRVNAILPRARTRLTDSEAIRPKEGRFDRWDPANVAPFVAYLLSDESEISGQAFLVAGSLVQRAAPWTLDPVWQFAVESRSLTFDDIAEAVARLGLPENRDRDTGLIR
jgi:NAD(P)-dependent dehydrogenase (short-subunit alcohol dehydrogenase family)